MKRLIPCFAFALLAVTACNRSDPAPGNDTTSNDPVKDPDVTTAAAPAPGANSFTEDQARERIAEAGFGNISSLVKNDAGLWEATAEREGKSGQVTLDYKGNVTSK